MSSFGPGDFFPGMTPLDAAHVYLGVVETTGPNRGPMIDKWLRRMGLDPENGPPGGYPWCAAFICCMCIDGQRPLPRPSAGVARVWERNKHLAVTIPERGDLCLRLTPGHTHIGMVTRVLPNGDLEVLSGNTNEKGSREGNAVEIKPGPASEWQGFLRPPLKAGA